MCVEGLGLIQWDEYQGISIMGCVLWGVCERVSIIGLILRNEY